MTWYKYWKKSGPTAQYSEEYVWLPGDIYQNEKSVLMNCEYWAERMPGGHNTRYEYGFEEVNNPPLNVLEKMIAKEREHIKYRREYLDLLKKSLKDAIDGTNSR